MQKEFDVKLLSVVRVQKFVNALSNFNQDIDIICGRYVVDAKSIMGIFSMDLRNNMKVRIHTDDPNECKRLEEALKDFIIEVEDE